MELGDLKIGELENWRTGELGNWNIRELKDSDALLQGEISGGCMDACMFGPSTHKRENKKGTGPQ